MLSCAHCTRQRYVRRFVSRIDALLARISKGGRSSAITVAVVGGGAGGVEVAFAVQHRLSNLLQHAAQASKAAHEEFVAHSAAQTSSPLLGSSETSKQHGRQQQAKVVLLSRGQILPSHPARARRLCLQAAADKRLHIMEHAEVTGVSAGTLHVAAGEQVPFDECLWCTQAAPARWLHDSHLPQGAQPCLSP